MLHLTTFYAKHIDNLSLSTYIYTHVWCYIERQSDRWTVPALYSSKHSLKVPNNKHNAYALPKQHWTLLKNLPNTDNNLPNRPQLAKQLSKRNDLVSRSSPRCTGLVRYPTIHSSGGVNGQFPAERQTLRYFIFTGKRSLKSAHLGMFSWV